MCLLLMQLILANGEFSGCTDGISCSTLRANLLDFECRSAGPSTGSKVMLLHGFPEWSAMFMPLMRALAARGYHSLACNLRGYSPGARPPLVTDYNYYTLASDVFALADAANFSAFHLVGHDHGSSLGYVVSASPVGRARVLSYASLAVPHPTAFAAGLFGPGADLEQQVASQYISMFTMNNSASMDLGLLSLGLKDKHSWAGEESFRTEADTQKALWWYNGAVDAGVLAMPPIFSAEELLVKYKKPAIAALRKLFPGCDKCRKNPNGFPGGDAIGNVTMPSLFVCGSKDSSIMCTHEYAKKTKYFTTADYTYLEVDCGHDVLTESPACIGAEVKKVTIAILELFDSI